MNVIKEILTNESDLSKFNFKTFKVEGENNVIEIAENSRAIGLRVTIRGNNNIVKISNNCALKGILFINGHNNLFEIGENSTVVEARFSLGGRKKIIIGKDCMFSRKIEVRTWDEHPIFDINTKEQINLGKDVIIGNHVWIGVGVDIGKGAVIPDGCVIGSGSLVTKELKSKNTVYVGRPLRLYRENIIWGRNRNNVPWQRLTEDFKLEY